MCRGGRRGRDGRAGGAGANQDLRGGVGVAAPTGRPSGRGVAEAELATGMKGRGVAAPRRGGGAAAAPGGGGGKATLLFTRDGEVTPGPWRSGRLAPWKTRG